MAQADGSIVFETKIDNSDAQKGLNQLQREIAKTEKNISSLEGKRSSISEQFEQASDSANEAQLKIRRMKAELQQAQAALDSKQGFDMPLEEFMRYQAIVADMPGEIAKQESEFEKLVSTVDKLNQKLISYDDQLSQANETLAQQTTQAGELTRQLSVGEPGAPDSSPKASQKETAKSAEQAAKGFTRMREAADKAKGSVSGLARAGAAIGRTVVAGVKATASAFAAMGRAAVTAFAAAGRGILSFVGHMNVFSRLTSGLGGKISRLGTMIKQAFVFNVISQGLNALRSQMSAYLSTNAAFSGALSNLQASLSTAFQPILDAAVPALVTLMNVLSSVITVIGRFLAALASIGGRAKTNTKALGAQAKATGGAGGAAEKAAKSLAKFDEINRLADDSAGGGGGGGGGGGDFDVDDFPEYEFDGVFKTWGEAFNAFLDTIIDEGLPRLRKALNEFAVWVNTFSANVYEMFTFPGVQEKIRYIGKEIALAFNDMVASIEWELLGRALGAGLNFALGFLVSNLYTFNWFDLGKSLAAALNGLADEVSWYEFGQLLWAGFKIGLETLAGFITNLEPEKLANAFNSMVEGWHASILETINEKIEWDKIGSNLAEVLNNIEWDKAISGAFDVIIGALNGGKKLVDGFVQRFNWKKTADSIKNGLNNGIHNIPWAGIGQTLGSLFSTALMFLSRVTSGIPFEEIGSGIATALNSAMEVVPWRELGSWLSTLFQGALKGLNTGIKTFDWNGLGRNVAEAINGVDWYELLKSLADTLLNAIDGALDLLIGLLEGLEWYKIAKEMASGLIEAIGKHDWGATVSKLYEALGAAVRAAGEIVLGVTDAIAEAIANGLLDSIGFFQNEIEEAGGNVWVGIQNGCKKAMLGIVEWIATHIIDPFLKGLGLTEGGYFRTRIEQAGGDIIAGLLQGIMDALGPIGELLERALKGTGDFWDDVFHITSTKTDDTRKAVETNMQGAGRSVKSEMDAAESTVAKVWGGITRTTNVKASAVRSTTAKEWSGTRTETEKTWSLIHSGLSTTWQNVQTTSATGAERTKTTVTDTWHNTQTDTETTWGAISQGLGSVWGEIGKTAGSKFHETQEAISTEWNNAQASTDTVWGDISQGLTTAWEGLNSTAIDKFTQIKDKITGAWRDSQRETDQKMDAIAIKVGAQAGFALKSVQDNFSKVSSAITTPLNSAKTTVQGLGWYGLGSNIVEGISAGVRAKAAALANSVANAAYNSLQAAKNVLGINSPSRLFRDIIGLGIVEGTAVGVEENQRMVDASIYGMAEDINDTFTDSIQLQDMLDGMSELSFDSVTDGIHALVQSVVSGVREMISALESLRNVGQVFSRTLPTPRLAGGGVIPQSREFLSVVSAEGGQSGVTEDAIRRIVREEAGGDNTGLLQAILDAVRAGHIIMVDRHVLGKTVTQEQNRMTRASGRSALLT